MYQIILEHLTKKQPLTKDLIQFFIESSIQETLVDQEKGQILKLLQEKGVTAKELAAFVEILLADVGTTRRVVPTGMQLQNAVDICGTGGSKLQRINTSTISAFILAALDIPIAKHGNKAASGRFGSFDLLEEMGLNIDASSELISYAYWKEHLAFLFARTFHPAMKHFVKVRQELGMPTVFNILGPLLSPVQAKYQIIGTAFLDKMELIAQAAQDLGKEKVLVVRGEDGLDEVTLCGRTRIVETHCNVSLQTYQIHPTDFGIEPVKDFSEIAGGDKNLNIKIANDILQGKCTSRHLDLVLVNSAIVLHMMERVKTLKEGYQRAKEMVESGKAWEKFLAYKEISNSHNKLYEIVGSKYPKVESQKSKVKSVGAIPCGCPKNKPTFKKALSKPGISLIAEIKKASPSKGIINEDINVVEIAKMCEASGASAISVLTDEKYFHGSLEDLKAVADSVNIPILRKDFIIDEIQIHEAAEAGASAVLLMASVLDKSQIEKFLEVAKELGLDCLVEVHSAEEMERVLETKAEIIGINNRDLSTMTIDLENTKRILNTVGTRYIASQNSTSQNIALQNRIIISESGINTTKDIQNLPQRIDGVLVGSSIMEKFKEGGPVGSSSNVGTRYIDSLQKAKKIFKACGIRSLEDAQFCEEQGVDMIGLNFVPISKRCICRDTLQCVSTEIKNIRSQCERTKVAGVFQNQPLDYLNQIAEDINLDYIQLSGEEDVDFVKQCNRPVIKTIKLVIEKDIETAKKYVPHCAYIIFDGRNPGSGELLSYKLLKQVDFPYILAGGITTENISEILKEINPIGIDVASGIEENGIVSQEKIKQFLTL